MLRLSILIFIVMVAHLAFAGTATVDWVYDGDTLRASVQGKMINVRLYGIDAPEGGQHGNVAATRFLRRLALDHPVRIKMMGTEFLEWPLVIVIRENKESSVNAAMVGNGYAWVNPKLCTADECRYWKQLESKARALKLGIWSNTDAVPPWEFAKQQAK